MEGFASSIRGTVRMVRETCYSILFCMSRLDIHFYGFVELPGPLAQALFADAHALSSHQMSVLLNVARFLVDDCPIDLRAHFLPPILASLFTQVDSKVSSEWEQLMRKAQATSDDDSLTQEMKEESILRQLTYSAVLMVAGLLDPQREAKPHAVEDNASALRADRTTQTPKTERPQSMRDFILSSDTILEPLILFCTHALRLRDQRCCSVIIRVFRSIVSKFSENRPDIREFICNEVLKASITSLHEDYFVELQRDLAQLIATIFILYSPHSSTPRHILLSLPGIEEHKFDQVAKQLFTVNSGRQQRALILDLLQGLRGQSIAEQGQITKPSQNAKLTTKRTALQQQLMTDDQEAARNREGTPDFGGLVDMFH
jgi:exportin-5